ncbi:MAG: hypothetical protein HZT40_11385 [Candidatus Thiothrix singaporensis]|uniref:Uncharacterized protein n=1 Tax=Candidatus Thiothrix singaporensis TaxID=2799669 RepID=A0A7L6ASH9_9GAMM|nr:MAG: hypothetical protein HZT40_11385 [Candidatus Thiothrix singaporensis]
MGKLHWLRVLDWIDLTLWSKLSGVTLEAQYLGDIFGLMKTLTADTGFPQEPARWLAN